MRREQLQRAKEEFGAKCRELAHVRAALDSEDVLLKIRQVERAREREEERERGMDGGREGGREEGGGGKRERAREREREREGALTL